MKQHLYGKSKGYTLLTGATGLVGQYLLRDMLLRGHRLAILVRPKRKQSAQNRVETILQRLETELGCFLPRPVVLVGDIRQKDFGLNESDVEWVTEHCSTMIHSAAILEFYGASKEAEPWLTNVEGTRNVLKVCEKIGIKEFHYVSTAYVCGNRPDLVGEEELDMGQQFRNDYERSKFEAESLVRKCECFEKLTVYRPAVIAGDSRSGYTSTYHGLHLYLRLMAMMVPMTEPDENGIRHTPIRLPMTGDEPRNIIPVDWVSRVICEIFDNPDAHGRTFHLIPEKPITPRLIVDSCYRYFNSSGVEYVGEDNFDVDAANDFEAKFLDAIEKYQAYDQTDPNFDSRNLDKYASHVALPEIDEQAIHRYLKFGETDKWGKQRVIPAVVELNAEDSLESVCKIAGQFMKSETYHRVMNRAKAKGVKKDLVIGLDVIGPGGGQWSVIATSDGDARIARGLPPGQAACLSLDIQEFVRMFDHSVTELAKSDDIASRFAFSTLAEAILSNN